MRHVAGSVIPLKCVHNTMSDQMSKSGFTAQVNSKFRVRIQDKPPLELELDQVEEGRSTPTQEQFSLIFHGPKDFNLGQGAFELEHEKMGTFSLFLVPIQPDERGPRYQAVFNRLVDSQS
jgi:hypothetical protein